MFLSLLQVCCGIWYRFPVSPLRHSLHSSLHKVHQPMLLSTHLSVGQVARIESVESAPIDIEYVKAANKLEDSKFHYLVKKYDGKFLVCNSTTFPDCEIFLCGTLHIAKSSCDMVREVVQGVRPDAVMIELCQHRLETLLDYARSLQPHASSEKHITLWEILKNAWKTRSMKELAMDLLSWMQCKAAQMAGNKLGEEFGVAALEAHKLGATVVLGDRRYDVTTQRIYDQLSWLEKIKLFVMLVWEVLTTSRFNVKGYIQQTEQNSTFVRDEIETFSKWMPKLGKIVIGERDQYMGRTICDAARQLSRSSSTNSRNSEVVSEGAPDVLSRRRKARLLAVVGAGHLEGLKRIVNEGDVSVDLVRALSVSSVHTHSTWSGNGDLKVLETQQIFGSVNISSK